MKPCIGSESRFLPSPPAFDAPVRGGWFPSEYCHAVWYGKIRMAWLPDGEKISKIMFIRFDKMHERDRHTQTDRHRMLAYRPRLYGIARQKLSEAITSWTGPYTCAKVHHDPPCMGFRFHVCATLRTKSVYSASFPFFRF